MAQCSKTPRRFLSGNDKQKVLSELKAGKPPLDVAAEFGISKTQVYSIRKKKCASIGKMLVPLCAKVASSRAKHPAIDRAVYEWFRSIRTLTGARKPLPVSRSMIKARALFEAKRQGVIDFRASDGWFYNWRWRCNVSKCTRLHGEAADVDLDAAEREMHVLRNALASYPASNVFNMDEAGLFYRAIPNRSYLAADEGDSRQVGRGRKAMKAKERVTIILCVNATGSCKMTPVVIGSAKNPRCFKRNPPSLPYYHQLNAWNDTINYNKWWDNVFLPAVRNTTQGPVALVVDGFSGHDDSCKDPLGQVKVFKFPPNVTSIYQPLDQGVIAALKVGYKSRLLGRLLETADRYDELQVLAKHLPAGHAGLQYGCQPHVGDAIMLLKEAWDSISPSTIAACWVHSKCLSVTDTAQIASECRTYNSKLVPMTIEAMCDKLSSLTLRSPSVVNMLATMDLAVLANAVQKVHDKATAILSEWLHLEEMGFIDVNDEGEDSDECQDAVDRVKLLNDALLLLQQLHSVGAKLDDRFMLDASRDLCLHIRSKEIPSAN